jgi:hypothetical protein
VKWNLPHQVQAHGRCLNTNVIHKTSPPALLAPSLRLSLSLACRASNRHRARQAPRPTSALLHNAGRLPQSSPTHRLCTSTSSTSTQRLSTRVGARLHHVPRLIEDRIPFAQKVALEKCPRARDDTHHGLRIHVGVYDASSPCEGRC